MIHKEGFITLLICLVLFGTISFLLISNFNSAIYIPVLVLIWGLYFFLISFFRNPTRSIPLKDDNLVYAPADGKVVVIEKAVDHEFFKEERLQVSIFMSPLNVHVNRAAISGEVIYKKYHKGKYLAAWNPKSSTENERCTIVLENKGKQVLLKQIAGALARRIVNYAKKGSIYQQGEDFGFIKLGSRVDLFLPIDAEIKVEMNQMVRGNLDVIAVI